MMSPESLRRLLNGNKNLNADQIFMQGALEEALKAEAKGEVPVGAVLVLNNEIIARAHNETILRHDPSAHAEILALREAGKSLQNYRLLDATLYVTLEPCLMCFSALVHARIQRLVFGAFDPKTGVCGSRFDAQSLEFFNHQFAIEGGVLSDDCGKMLQGFFKKRR